MGGIRNLEAKKKANHVVSSGAGGGAKGPSIVDKRTQEVKCPYCDKVYTLANSGRLKDHTSKQHKEEDEAAKAAAGSTSAAAAPSRPESSKRDVRPDPSRRDNRPELSTETAAAGKSQAPTAAAAPSASQSRGSSQGKQGSQAQVAAGTTPGSSNGGSSSAAGGMMDVGAGAGFYTHKSPKMHLAEWCQREKFIKPRYTIRKQADGSTTCKVVLPHPRKQDEDVVVFLDSCWAKDANGNEQELEQRAAVAALHHVAGDRNYHMLLPKQYVPLWQEMGQHQAERRQAAERREAAQAERAKRDAERAVRDRARAPTHLIMSREKQAMIQELIRRRDQQAYGADTARSCISAAGTASGDGITAQLLPQFLAMGFSASQVHMAVETLLSSGLLEPTSVDRSDSHERVLDWLLTRISSEQLPTQFTQGHHHTQAVTKRTAAAAGGGNTPAEGLSAEAAQQSQLVGELAEYGYAAAACELALAQSGGNLQSALALLFSQLVGVSQPLSVAGKEAGTADNQEWEEERMVLEAIYGEDVACDTTAGSVHITLPMPDTCAAAVQVPGSRISLHAWCSSSSDGSTYPSSVPLLGVQCAALQPGHLRHLTHHLATHAAGLLGQPMLHELASHLSECLEQLQPGDTHNMDDPGDQVEDLQQDLGSDLEEGDNDDMDLTELESSLQGSEQQTAASDAGTVRGSVGEGDGNGDGEGDDEGLLIDQFEGTGLGDLGPDEEEADEQPQSGSQVIAQQLDSSSIMQRGRMGGEQLARPPAQAAVAVPGTTNTDNRKEPSGPRYTRPRRAIDITAENQRLASQQQSLQQAGGAYADLQRARGQLPAAGMRGQVLEALKQHAVLVVSGGTGTGKSTQVPQFILEDAISRGCGATTNIIVTQPRRISALGLAQRVAAERGEEVGETVGYSVRLDSRTSARTRLLFCTTGILLRRLLSDPQLTGTTHVILDEVHERSIEIDLLLLLLRDVIAQRARAPVPTGSNAPSSTTPPPLQLVLMSATADSQLFADYMDKRLLAMQAAAGGAPFAGYQRPVSSLSVGQLTIPGFTHPVRELYLEDIFELTGYIVGKGSKYAKKGGGGKADKAAEAEEVLGLEAGAGGGATAYSDTTIRSLAMVDQELINYDALAALVTYTVRQQQQHGPRACMDQWPEGLDSLAKLKDKAHDAAGAVLVFLPGAPEINRAARMLKAHAALADAAGGAHRLHIMPLHGSLSARDQSAVFARMPAGHIKIVLSTNVAETSITIDDVSFVIDTGRAKEMQHDTERAILRLQEQWVSKAAAQQRRGRAGRVRPGIGFRLFSRSQWARMPSHTAPEMLRSPLESVVLLIKGMAAAHQAGKQQGRSAAMQGRSSEGPGGGKPVAQVLQQCLSPPDPQAVRGAVELLQHVGALDASEVLTPLGHHLKQMPMDPRVGKMLVFGCMLGCLDPILTIAAAMAHGRPVFMSPAPEQAADVAAMRRNLLQGAVTARSDHIALVAAFNEWSRRLNRKGGRTEAAALCTQAALSESSLEAVAAGRAEYAGVLADLGFLPRHAAQMLHGQSRGKPRSSATDTGDYNTWMSLPANQGAGNARFLKAAVMAGFYPSVLRVQHPPTTYRKLEGAGAAVETESDPKTLRFFDKTRGRVFIHPGSVNFPVGKFDSGWLVYTQMTATSKLFVRECSMAPVYSLLLFGGQLHVDHVQNMVMVDDVASFKAPSHVGVLIKELRAELTAVLARKISDPSYEMATDETVTAVLQLLSTDGF